MAEFPENMHDAIGEALLMHTVSPEQTLLHHEDVEMFINTALTSYPMLAAMAVAAGQSPDVATRTMLRTCIEFGFTVGRIFQSHDFPLPATPA